MASSGLNPIIWTGWLISSSTPPNVGLDCTRNVVGFGITFAKGVTLGACGRNRLIFPIRLYSFTASIGCWKFALGGFLCRQVAKCFFFNSLCAERPTVGQIQSLIAQFCDLLEAGDGER